MTDDHMKNSHEKRGKARIDITQDITVKEDGSGTVIGMLANIHSDGMMLISSLNIEEGSVYKLTLEADADVPVVTLSAECLWNSPTGTGEQYWVGFQITDVSAPHQTTFDTLISHFDT